MYILILLAIVMNLNQVTQQITDVINSFDIKNPNHIKVFTCLVFFCVGIYSLNFIGMIFSVLIGIAYPIIKSYNAIKMKSVDDLISIVIYWIFFSIVTLCELMFGAILQLIPFYYIIKTLLFGYATHYDGAKYLYDIYLCPIIEKYDVDKVNEFIKILGIKLTEANAEFNRLKSN